MKKTALHLSVCLAACLICSELAAKPEYPPATRGQTVDRYFGVEVADPYRWLEDDHSEATQAWAQAQHKRTQEFLAGPERQRLKQRFSELWDYPKVGTPSRHGKFYFRWKNNGLQAQYALYRQAHLHGEETLVLDPNTLSQDGTRAIRNTSISPDGRFLAYGISEAGSDKQDLYIRDLNTGQDLPDVIRGLRNSSIDWHPNNLGLIYNRYPSAEELPEAKENSHSRVYFHRLGSEQSQDQLLMEQPQDPSLDLYPGFSEKGDYIIVAGYRGTDPKNALFVKKTAAVLTPRHTPQDWQPLQADGVASLNYISNQGAQFYFTSTRDAARGKVVAWNLDSNQQRTLIPEQNAVLDAVILANHHLVVKSLEMAQHQLKVYDLLGQELRRIPLPAPGTVSSLNGEFADSELFFSFSSFVYPGESYRYDLDTHVLELIHRSQVKFNPERYTTQQIVVPSKDGTQIPVFLVHRKDLQPDGTHPALLYGYGGFNVSLRPHFALSRIPWLEAGGVYAVANLRGGGEFGDAWHEMGMLDKKQNVFDDFIAVGESLIQKGWSHPHKLAIQGGSNGGLLTAAAMIQRPDLFGAVISQVPVIDMLRYHKYSVGRFWIPEYGNAENSKQEFETLYAYSPLHNIEKRDYPPILVMTADHDDRVLPAHAMKFVASLQHADPGDNPILLRVETRAGHGAGKPTGKILDELADMYSFLFKVFELKPQEQGLP